MASRTAGRRRARSPRRTSRSPPCGRPGRPWVPQRNRTKAPSLSSPHSLVSIYGSRRQPVQAVARAGAGAGGREERRGRRGSDRREKHPFHELGRGLSPEQSVSLCAVACVRGLSRRALRWGVAVCPPRSLIGFLRFNPHCRSKQREIYKTQWKIYTTCLLVYFAFDVN